MARCDPGQTPCAFLKRYTNKRSAGVVCLRGKLDGRPIRGVPIRKTDEPGEGRLELQHLSLSPTARFDIKRVRGSLGRRHIGKCCPLGMVSSRRGRVRSVPSHRPGGDQRACVAGGPQGTKHGRA